MADTHLIRTRGGWELRRRLVDEHPTQGQLLAEGWRTRHGFPWRTPAASGLVHTEPELLGILHRHAGRLPCRICGQDIIWRIAPTAPPPGQWGHLLADPDHPAQPRQDWIVDLTQAVGL